jgi:hypothetical protein
MNVYFCASHLDSVNVRHLQDGVRQQGLVPVSTWPYEVVGPERLDDLQLSQVRAIADRNDRDLRKAHIAVVLARDGVGAEMFAEARLALSLGIPALWVGTRRPLSAYREGVHRVDDVVHAMKVLRGLRRLAIHAARLAQGRDGEDSLVRFALWQWIEFYQRADAAGLFEAAA